MLLSCVYILIHCLSCIAHAQLSALALLHKCVSLYAWWDSEFMFLHILRCPGNWRSLRVAPHGPLMTWNWSVKSAITRVSSKWAGQARGSFPWSSRSALCQVGRAGASAEPRYPSLWLPYSGYFPWHISQRTHSLGKSLALNLFVYHNTSSVVQYCILFQCRK